MIEFFKIMLQVAISVMQKMMAQPANPPINLHAFMNLLVIEPTRLAAKQAQDVTRIPAAVPNPLPEKIRQARHFKTIGGGMII